MRENKNARLTRVEARCGILILALFAPMIKIIILRFHFIKAYKFLFSLFICDLVLIFFLKIVIVSYVTISFELCYV